MSYEPMVTYRTDVIPKVVNTIMTLRSGRVIGGGVRDGGKYIYVKAMPEKAMPEKAANDKTGVIRILQNYLDTFEKIKAIYMIKNVNNKSQVRVYYVEMMRVIIEMYSIMNENFDYLVSKSRDSFLRISQEKAIEFVSNLNESTNRALYRGRDLALYRNCIAELNDYIDNVNRQL
jgi:hypothetical protein